MKLDLNIPPEKHLQAMAGVDRNCVSVSWRGPILRFVGSESIHQRLTPKYPDKVIGFSSHRSRSRSHWRNARRDRSP